MPRWVFGKYNKISRKMIFEFKRPKIGDTKTIVSYCLLPRKFKGEGYVDVLWFHRLETNLEYDWWIDEDTNKRKEGWTILERTFKT